MEILIVGKATEGKTTLALEIANLLEEMGMRVSVEDADIPTEPGPGGTVPRADPRTVAALRDRVVKISTYNAR